MIECRESSDRADDDVFKPSRMQSAAWPCTALQARMGLGVYPGMLGQMMYLLPRVWYVRVSQE